MYAEVTSHSVPSEVENQPFLDEETMKGEVNRAKRALQEGEAQSCIGLVGGVMKTADGLFMCNWGALATSDGKTFVAGVARI
ncbi:DUF84 family protein, partial [Bacillus nitratireducens]|uniref:DUF84 family protein n=1 Tax=Bacillus nitratireducens TaxID=2026193 RepID=UPI0028524A31